MDNLSKILNFLAFISIIVCGLGLILMPKLRQMFAYSSILNIGYMLIIIAHSMQDPYMALTITLLLILNHSIATGLLFSCVGRVIVIQGDDRLEDLAGLGKRMPFLAATIVIAGLSLIGVPGTVGFVAKFFLIKYLLQNNAWVSVAFVLIGTLFAIAAFWRMVEHIYFKLPKPYSETDIKPSIISNIVAIIMIIIIIVGGMAPSTLINKLTELKNVSEFNISESFNNFYSNTNSGEE